MSELSLTNVRLRNTKSVHSMVMPDGKRFVAVENRASAKVSVVYLTFVVVFRVVDNDVRYRKCVGFRCAR